MENSHLEHILSEISDLKRNTWTEGYTSGIHNNWIRAFRRGGYPYEIERKERNLPYFTLKAEDDSVIGEMTPWVLPSCDPVASRICANKVRTHQTLEARKIATPLTRVYGPDEVDQAYEEAFKNADEVVIKAHNLSQGIGVYLNIDRDHFKKTFATCVELQNERKRSPRVLVQEMVNGFEIRGTVIEGQLSDVILRIPAYVIGDGTSNITELIDAKNIAREADRYLKPRKIRVDHNLEAYMRSRGIRMVDVPARGEAVLLSAMSNIGYGGETAIVTHLVSDEIKKLAIDAVAAIPGLYTAGVDLMVDSLKSTSPQVLEVNSFPHAYISCYPTYGQEHNPLAEYLVAYYSRHKLKRDPEAELTVNELNAVSEFIKFCELKDKLSIETVRL